MKILLQHKETKLFLTRTGQWEREPALAWEFDSAAEAFKWCVEMKVSEVSIILRFRQFGQWVDVPLEAGSFCTDGPLPAVLQPLSASTSARLRL